MKRTQKATAPRMAPTVPLLMDHMTCAVPFMISGVQNWASCQFSLFDQPYTCASPVAQSAFFWRSFVFYREVQVMESQGGSGAAEGSGGDGQSGQAASTALIEKILSEEPRWQGKSLLCKGGETNT